MSETHLVTRATSRRTRSHTIYTAVCSCGAQFDSITSAGMAHSYHTAHAKKISERVYKASST